jgi:putative ABC transport system substrate-binding protein
MRRREFIALLGSAVATLPVAVQAQETKPARLGFLITDSLQNPQVKVGFDALQQGLRKLGYIDGQNITIEYREAGNRFERFPDLVNDLLGLHVDVIVVPNSAWARSAQRVTRTVPIVVAAMGDPVRDGLVASLARPGGNITGSTFLGQELVLSGTPTANLASAACRATRSSPTMGTCHRPKTQCPTRTCVSCRR